MADRYVGTPDSLTKVGAKHRYKIGDVVFVSLGNHTGAGEAMFIGRLKDSPEDLVLVSGSQMVETWEGSCAPLGGGRSAEAQSWRRESVCAAALDLRRGLLRTLISPVRFAVRPRLPAGSGGQLEGNIFGDLAGCLRIAWRVGFRGRNVVACKGAFPFVEDGFS